MLYAAIAIGYAAIGLIVSALVWDLNDHVHDDYRLARREIALVGAVWPLWLFLAIRALLSAARIFRWLSR